jgi:pantoate--beta-alanine ligase
VEVVRSREELAASLPRLREGGRTLGLVPTMGFLHEGHLSLVDRAAALTDRVAVSLFVNPLQFGPSEDLAAYPRDEVRDLALLRERGAALVFAPSVAEMYPEGEPAVTVSPGALERRLCGAFRPGHFRGVLTVVAKLFGLLRPDVAVFGRKDFQQAVLIDRMARDLELGVRVVTGPIVREPDGLAMSSRNTYLSPEERAAALCLYRALVAARELALSGAKSRESILAAVRQIISSTPLTEIDYLALVHPETLKEVDTIEGAARLLLAVKVGRTRLIDNTLLAETLLCCV